MADIVLPIHNLLSFLMSKSIRALFFFVFVLFLFFMGSTEVSAQTPALQRAERQEERQQNLEDIQSAIEENRQQFQENREERINERCDIATNRIDTTTARYEENRVRYVNRYNNLVQRIDNVINFLSDTDADVTGLESYQDQIRVLTDDFNQAIYESINLLEETKELACGESEGAYLDKLQESRDAHLEARDAAVQINNIFLVDVINELEEIRANL